MFVCCVCVGLMVCLPPRLSIASSMIWHDVDPVWFVKQVSHLLYGSCIGINSKRGVRIEMYHKNQPNKKKVVLYKLLLSP